MNTANITATEKQNQNLAFKLEDTTIESDEESIEWADETFEEPPSKIFYTQQHFFKTPPAEHLKKFSTDILDEIELLQHIAFNASSYTSFQKTNKNSVQVHIEFVSKLLLLKFKENLKTNLLYTKISFACCLGDLDTIHKLVFCEDYNMLPLMCDFELYARPYPKVTEYLDKIKNRASTLRKNFQSGKYFEEKSLKQHEKDEAFMWACINGDFEDASKLSLFI
jgi:hypothetical protein